MKKFMMSMFVLLFIVAVSCVGSAKKAEALGTMQMKINATGMAELIITDEVFLEDETFGTTGSMSKNFSFGQWTVAFTAASTKPFNGSASNPSMHLSLVAFSTGAGVISAELTGTGFTNAADSFFARSGGSANPTSIVPTLDLWTDAGNTAFGHASHIVSLNTFGSTAVGAATGVSPYSMSLRGSLTFDQAGSASLDQDVYPTPEPGTVALLGIGLAGLVGVGARRRAKKKAA